MSPTRSLWHWLKGVRHSGTATVELAVSLPIILSALLGIIDSGQIFWVRQIMISASREGARALTTRVPNPTQAQKVANLFLAQYFTANSTPKLSQITVTTNPNTVSSNQVTRTVTVQVPLQNVLLVGNWLGSYTIPLTNPTTGNATTITGNTTFRCEQ